MIVKSNILGPNGKPLTTHRRTFDAATQGKRAYGIHAPNLGPRSSLDDSLQALRDRSRAAHRNNALHEAALEKNAINEIGDGFTVSSTCEDKAVRDDLNSLWQYFCESIDTNGLHNFNGLLLQAALNRDLSGECFGRAIRRKPTSRLKVPLQVQLLEADQVPYSKTDLANNVVQGIQYIGPHRTGYWVHPFHPSDATIESNEPVFINQAEMFQHCRPPRIGQVRVSPRGMSSYIRLHTLNEYDDTELVRKRNRASLVGVLTMEDFGEGEPDFDENDFERNKYFVNEIGSFMSLPPGEKADLHDADNQGNGYFEYAKSQLMQIAQGYNLPYPHFSGDWSGLNDRLVRAINEPYHRMLRTYQKNFDIHQVIKKIYRWFVDTCILTGLVPVRDYGKRPEYYRTFEAYADPHLHLHPVQDAQATNENVANHRSNVFRAAAERGDSLEHNMRRNIEGAKLFDDLCAELGVTPEQALAFIAKQNSHKPNEPKTLS